MAARHLSRQRALQVLYQWDLSKQPVEQAISAFYDTLYSEENERKPGRDSFMEELAKGTSEMASDIDSRISAKSENWKLERMPIVDRNILRLAIYEMLHREDIPPVVSINEAVDIAKKFSTQDSGKFVNGILDKIKGELMRPARIVK